MEVLCNVHLISGKVIAHLKVNLIKHIIKYRIEKVKFDFLLMEMKLKRVIFQCSLLILIRIKQKKFTFVSILIAHTHVMI